MIGRANDLLAPCEVLSAQGRPGSQLPNRGDRALVAGKVTDGDLINADALFDDNKVLAPRCDGACSDLELEG